jgi:hypothetical protein
LGSPARDAQAEAGRLRRELVKVWGEAPPVEAIAVLLINARIEVAESTPDETDVRRFWPART